MSDSVLTAPSTYDVNDIAGRCKCSIRHVWRMRDAGILPQPIKLGSLVRWNAELIDDWIRRGCSPCRKGKR
jgi:predicted DNA-binding transcriptional regulator AlpA